MLISTKLKGVAHHLWVKYTLRHVFTTPPPTVYEWIAEVNRSMLACFTKLDEGGRYRWIPSFTFWQDISMVQGGEFAFGWSLLVWCVTWLAWGLSWRDERRSNMMCLLTDGGVMDPSSGAPKPFLPAGSGPAHYYTHWASVDWTHSLSHTHTHTIAQTS